MKPWMWLALFVASLGSVVLYRIYRPSAESSAPLERPLDAESPAPAPLAAPTAPEENVLLPPPVDTAIPDPGLPPSGFAPDPGEGVGGTAGGVTGEPPPGFLPEGAMEGFGATGAPEDFIPPAPKFPEGEGEEEEGEIRDEDL